MYMDGIDQAITDISIFLMDAHIVPEGRFRAIRALADEMLWMLDNVEKIPAPGFTLLEPIPQFGS